jgi:hypothetical protein
MGRQGGEGLNGETGVTIAARDARAYRAPLGRLVQPQQELNGIGVWSGFGALALSS